jgi:hypothetical protein
VRILTDVEFLNSRATDATSAGPEYHVVAASAPTHAAGPVHVIIDEIRCSAIAMQE